MNLKTADDLFQQSKAIKELFPKSMISYRNGSSTQDTPADFVNLLYNLYNICNALDIPLINKLPPSITLTGLSGDSKNNSASYDLFIRQYLHSLNNILMSLTLYRKHYALLRRSGSLPGLGSNILAILSQICESINDGYIPIIDMVNDATMFSPLSHTLGKNVWEVFFKQPFSISLDTFDDNAHFTIRDSIPSFGPNCSMDFYTNTCLINSWKSFMKKYAPFSDFFMNHVNQVYAALPFHTSARILGVLCRGTDYTSLHPYEHPVPPSLEDSLAKAEETMNRYKCDYIYLATEDSKIESAFFQTFKDKLITTQCTYSENTGNDFLSAIYQKENNDLYKINLDYLTAIVLLSKCNCFIGARTCGTTVALLLSDKYEYFHVWNEGHYGTDDAMTLQSLGFINL